MEHWRERPLPELLHDLELRLTAPAVEELIRLVSSPHFRMLTTHQIRAVGEYRTIEIEGERYFERAFSSGKEASSSLDLVQMLGREEALADLRNLRATLGEAA